MSKEEKIQKILDNWKGEGRAKSDSWENVKSVLDYHGFSYVKKSHWVCSHPVLLSLARDLKFKPLIQQIGLDPLGQLSVATTHGEGKSKDLVIRPYLNNIMKALELIEIHLAHSE